MESIVSVDQSQNTLNATNNTRNMNSAAKTTHQLNDIKAIVEKLSRLASELSATRHHSSTIHSTRSHIRQQQSGAKYELLEINHEQSEASTSATKGSNNNLTTAINVQQSPRMSPANSPHKNVTALREKVRGIARQVAQFEEVN
jgi:hypothetical protein